MKAKALSSLGTKLIITSCKNLIQSFRHKLKLQKPISIKTLLRPRSRPTKPKPKPKTSSSKSFHKKNRVSSFFSGFCSFGRPSSEEMDRLTELCSVSEAARDGMLFPSPLTPAFVKPDAPESIRREVEEEVEDEACRSFEKYLVEMIVEEGKVKDLKDVEELLHCWKSLKSPVFVDLVCRFYGELCKDLFSPDDEDEAGPEN